MTLAKTFKALFYNIENSMLFQFKELFLAYFCINITHPENPWHKSENKFKLL